MQDKAWQSGCALKKSAASTGGGGKPLRLDPPKAHTAAQKGKEAERNSNDLRNPPHATVHLV